MFFFQEGFTYRNFLMDAVSVFAFVVWFWLLIVIYGDLFRRHKTSGNLRIPTRIARFTFPLGANPRRSSRSFRPAACRQDDVEPRADLVGCAAMTPAWLGVTCTL
jgi:hypothetical protein